MGKTLRKCPCFSGKNNEMKIFNVLLLGFTGAGKTQIGHVISGERRRDFAVTNGVRKYIKKIDENYLLNITEIGGSKEMQKIWHHYFIKAMAIIYVIDLSDINNITNAFNTFKGVVKNNFIQGKPILIMITKADLLNEIEINELEDFYELELLANTYKNPMLMLEFQLNDYLNLIKGLHWLQNKLTLEYKNLSNRIKFDSGLAKVKNYSTGKNFKTDNYVASRPLTAPSRLNKIDHNEDTNYKNIRLRRVFVTKMDMNSNKLNNYDENSVVQNKNNIIDSAPESNIATASEEKFEHKEDLSTKTPKKNYGDIFKKIKNNQIENSNDMVH